jgi:putative hydrolase of the HAD superfamily
MGQTKESSRDIRNVIFDIGNVMISYDTERFIRSVLGDDPELIRRITEDVWGSGLWSHLDLGIISEEEILRQIVELDPEIESEIRLLWNNVGVSICREEHAIPWIEAVKDGGYHTYFLSNYSNLVMRANLDALDFLPLMEGGIFSCYVKLAKPDPRIYELLCRRYELNPQDCLFIDDSPENVKTAEKLGMATILCKDFRQVQEEAREKLGLNCEIF